jgi:hypothetical protein
VQWALDPLKDGPLQHDAELSEAQRDGLLVRVSRRVAERLAPREPDVAAPTAAPPPDVVAEEVTASGVPGPLDGVPATPPGYVERADLARIRGDGAARALVANITGVPAGRLPPAAERDRS